MDHVHATITCELPFQSACEGWIKLKEEQMRIRRHPARNLARMHSFPRAVFGDHARLAEIHLAGYPFHHRFRAGDDRCDLKLPDGPADDVYDAIKEEQPECSIIIITGYPDSAMLDRILSKGPITVLKKPLKVEQLKETVRILGHKEAVKLAA